MGYALITYKGTLISLFQLYTNASNVTAASGITMNLSNNIKSSMNSIH